MNSRQHRHKWTRLSLIALAASVIAVGVTACGDDDEDAGDGGNGGDPQIAQAQRDISAAEKPLTFSPPGPDFDASEASGSRVMIFSTDQRIPILATVAEAVEEAAQEVGVQTRVYDAKSQFPLMQQGIRQAISQQDDAVILLGFPIGALPAPLQQLEQAGIPAISVSNSQPDPDAPGQGGGPSIYASSAQDFARDAKLVAQKALVDTNGEANVEIFNTSEVFVSETIVESMREVLDQCSGCTVKVNDTPLAEWATELTPKAQTAVRGNPNLNYALPIFDGMGIFVTAGIQQAGAGNDVHVASLNGTPAALELIQTGDTFTADPAASFGWIGWHALDQAMRGILGLEPSDPVIPSRFLTKENLEGVDVNDLDEPYGNPEYREGFRSIWGVG